MNLLKTTSLFLFVYFFTCHGYVFAQQKMAVDSAKYWAKMILNPKEGQDLTEGYLFFEKATKKSLEANDTINSIYNLSILTIADFELSFFHDSEKDAVHALKLLDEMETSEWKSETTISIHNSLGKTHRALKDYESAIDSYNNVLKLTDISNDSVTAYNNKGNVYKDENKDQKALTQYLLAYIASLKNTDSIENARVLDNLGYIQSKLQDSQGFNKMKEALKMRILKNDYSGIFASYSNFSEYYKQKGQLDSALFYANELYNLAKDHHGLKYQQEALSILLKLDDSPYAQEYINITDTLTKWKLRQGVKYSHAKYNVEKEREKARQKSLAQKLQSEEEKKRQRLLFIGLGILLLISSIFLYFIQNTKHKREKTKEVIRETFQTERRLSKKVHDELANDMSDTLNYIDNHDKIPNDIKDYLLDRLDDLYDRTRDISAEIDGFDSTDFAKSLKFLITQHNTEGVKVITNVTSGINWDKISDHKKMNIYRTLQELLVNMRKHSKATEVTVIFKSEGKKHFINYTDNGIGAEIENVHLRGLQNAETRIKNIGGSITFNSSKGNGFKAHLHFLS